MFLIMFKTGHALPLVSTRILRPQSGRGTGANESRNVGDLCPQPRQVRRLDSVTDTPPTRTFRIGEQSASAFSPRPPARSQTIRTLEHALDWPVQEQASDTNSGFPQTVRCIGSSASTNFASARVVSGHCLATTFPRHSIIVSIPPPVHFPVHIDSVPTYDRV